MSLDKNILLPDFIEEHGLEAIVDMAIAFGLIRDDIA